MAVRVGLVGGRGYVGRELLGLLVRHPRFEPAWALSRSRAGVALTDEFPDLDLPGLVFEDVAPDRLDLRGAELVVLALSNGEAAPWVEALDGRARLLDISADYRFDEHWIYGLPELDRSRLADAPRVSNPGCYATAGQLALAPIVDRLDGVPSLFGVSGYSGAGRTPSPRNDPERLRDNLMPYALSGHLHEREMSRHLNHAVRFMPHVAAFFRGISMTVSATLADAMTAESLAERFRAHYEHEPLVTVGDGIPEVREVRNTVMTRIGGFAVDARDPRRVALVACLDNLLKGAASQAVQNLNRMAGFPETEGLTDD